MHLAPNTHHPMLLNVTANSCTPNIIYWCEPGEVYIICQMFHLARILNSTCTFIKVLLLVIFVHSGYIRDILNLWTKDRKIPVTAYIFVSCISIFLYFVFLYFSPFLFIHTFLFITFFSFISLTISSHCHHSLHLTHDCILCGLLSIVTLVCLTLVCLLPYS